MQVLPPPRFATRWGTLYAALWLAVLTLVVMRIGDDVRRNLPLLVVFALAWIGLHWLILRFWSRLRWLVMLFVVLLIIVAGQSIPALHRLDAALMLHRPTLRLALPALAGAGFALFMGGIVHLLLTKKTPESEEISFAELKEAWQSGAWRDSIRVKRFFVIGGGVLLAITAGVAAAVVFAPPGIKLLVLLAWGYALARICIGMAAATGPRGAAPRRPSGAGPRARS